MTGVGMHSNNLEGVSVSIPLKTNENATECPIPRNLPVSFRDIAKQQKLGVTCVEWPND